MEFIHKQIHIPGLKNTYRVMHITDSHVVKMDARDEGVVIVDSGYHHGRLVTDWGNPRIPVFTENGVTSTQRFANLCASISAEPDCADLIVFTGDILDFFTESGLEFLTEMLDTLPIPYMFVMGNHDSIFAPTGEEKTRQRFAHLCGGNTEVQKFKLGELAIVGIDNARDRYTEAGIAQLRQAMEGEEHVILCQHIPLCTDAYYEHAMAVANCCYALGGQGVCVDDSWKTVFAMIEAEDSPVRALMCGDCHREHVSYIGKAAMHTTALTARNAPALFTISG